MPKIQTRPSGQYYFIAVACCFAAQLRAQEVAEIPFFYAEPGTAALGGGIRGGQNP